MDFEASGVAVLSGGIIHLYKYHEKFASSGRDNSSHTGSQVRQTHRLQLEKHSSLSLLTHIKDQSFFSLLAHTSSSTNATSSLRMHFNAVFAAAVLAGTAAAHPGHSVAQELRERREFLSTTKARDLGHCAAKLKARGVEARNAARRAERVEAARAKRALKAGNNRRTLDSVLATDHNETSLGYTPSTDAATLFSSNASCILTPDVTQGPYYVGGEYIRSNVTEDQEGIPTTIDYQVIDVETCEPVPNVYLEAWHCNATGKC